MRLATLKEQRPPTTHKRHLGRRPAASFIPDVGRNKNELTYHMTKREEYGIKFYRRESPFGETICDAETSNAFDRELTRHISSCDADITEDQINELQKALDGIQIQEEWGEIMGSTLDINPQEGTVQIGYMNRRIPIIDFKQLLEEWLAFIKS